MSQENLDKRTKENLILLETSFTPTSSYKSTIVKKNTSKKVPLKFIAGTLIFTLHSFLSTKKQNLNALQKAFVLSYELLFMINKHK